MGKPLRAADSRDSAVHWVPGLLPTARRTTPNVLYIVWSNSGLADWAAFGGPVPTPNLTRLAALGLRYSQWHTAAPGWPTWSCLLTGHTPGASGVDSGPERHGGGPRSTEVIRPENATLAEILTEQGYQTYCVGKWHLSPAAQPGLGNSRRSWPLSRGFQRFYGFLGEKTNQWYPDLVYDNQYVDPPYLPADGYHLSRDLADSAIEFISDGAETTPARPWFCCLSFGPDHPPNYAPPEWVDGYGGRFDIGYVRYRENAPGALTRLDGIGKLRPAHRTEADGGFCSYTDHQVGRLINYLQASRQLADTIVVVCPASGEASLNWRGRMRTADPAHDTGERYAPAERRSLAPLIITWAAEMRAVAGEVRDQYHHAADIVPTILDCAGVEASDIVSGRGQVPIEGSSMTYTFHPEGALRMSRASSGGRRR